MPDRLPELRRQRALVAEQLAWLDRELAAAGGETPTPPASSQPPATPAPAALSPPAHPVVDADLPSAENILEEFRHEAELSPAKMRRGCIWSFICGLALLILGVTALYWLRYR